MKVKKVISDYHTMYGHLVDSNKVFVIGESWHGYEGAVGYQELDSPYYDNYTHHWIEDITEQVTPL